MGHADSSRTCEPAAACAAAQCRWRCAIDVIDDLLRQPGAVTGDEMDQLLELRWQIGRAEDAEATLRLFCTLRIVMERKHYLAFFRIRRWLENHLTGVRRHAGDATVQRVPVRLDHYCVEAIRRVCLCSALGGPDFTSGARLRFEFVHWPAVTAPTPEAAFGLAS